MPLTESCCGKCRQPITGRREYLTTVTHVKPGRSGRRVPFHFGCFYPSGPAGRLPMPAAYLAELAALDPARAAYFFDADSAQSPPADALGLEWTHWGLLQHARRMGAADYAQHQATIHNPYSDAARRVAWAQGYVDAALATREGKF